MDGNAVHIPSTMSHVQYYPRPNTRTSTASSSPDSASSDSATSSEGVPATHTDFRPPPTTEDFLTFLIEAQVQELSFITLLSHRQHLPTKAPAPTPPPQPPHTYPTTLYPSPVALSDYSQLHLHTCLGQLVLFVASRACLSAGGTKNHGVGKGRGRIKRRPSLRSELSFM